MCADRRVRWAHIRHRDKKKLYLLRPLQANKRYWQRYQSGMKVLDCPIQDRRRLSTLVLMELSLRVPRVYQGCRRSLLHAELRQRFPKVGSAKYRENESFPKVLTTRCSFCAKKVLNVTDKLSIASVNKVPCQLLKTYVSG
jgi:hypothetical protein